MAPIRGIKQDWEKTRSREWQLFGCLVLSRPGKSDIEPLFWEMSKLHARKSTKAHRQVVQDGNSSGASDNAFWNIELEGFDNSTPATKPEGFAHPQYHQRRAKCSECIERASGRMKYNVWLDAFVGPTIVKL
jgi:hypothetical protein